MPVQPATVCGQEDRPVRALDDSQVDRSARRERDRHDLAALASDGQRPVPALDTQGLDVGAGGVGLIVKPGPTDVRSG